MLFARFWVTQISHGCSMESTMSVRIGFAILFSLALLLGASLPVVAQSDSQQTSEQKDGQQSSEQKSEGDNKSANDQAADQNQAASVESQGQSQATQTGQDQFITRQESSQVL